MNATTIRRIILASMLTAAPMAALMGGKAWAESPVDNYGLFCVQCHGTKGVGRGINAPSLAVQPRNHTSAKDMGALSDDNIFKAIKEGGVSVGKSTQMPPFGGVLTDQEIKDLVKYLRVMCKC